MSWKRWLPEYEVPKRVEKLVSSGILKDKTSYRDIVPHFEAVLSDGSELVLWVDHPREEQRSVPEGFRYGFDLHRKGELPKAIFVSNNLDEALTALKGILEDYGGMRLL